MQVYILFIAIILSSNSLSAFSESLPMIKNVKSCFRGHAETHEQWLNFLESNNKKFNKKRFLNHFSKERFNLIKANLICKDFNYEVDGYTIEGYYLEPRNISTKKFPLIIYNRGGNAEYGYVTFGKKLQLISDIAMEGYVVIGSQYRGASVDVFNNGLDEFGGADVNDVLALVKVATEIPNADVNNIGMVGWSRGVMQSYIASKSVQSLKTQIAIAGNSDAEKALLWRPKMEKVYKARVPNFDKNRIFELESRSVIKWLDEIPSNMPILLLHGDKDKRVNVEQSKSLAAQLEVRKHPHKLVIYPNDNHGLLLHRKEMTQEIISWLKNNLSS